MQTKIRAAVAFITIAALVACTIYLARRSPSTAPMPHVGAAAAPFVWSRTTDTFASDANHTAPTSILNYHEISVSGTQTNKQYIVPLVAGQEWLISNNTTSQFTVIGASGTGVPVDKGARALVHCNGTNIYGVAASVGDQWANDYGGTGTRMPIPGSEVCVAQGTSYRVCNAAGAATTTDAATWTTLASFIPSVGTGRDCDAKFIAWDEGADGGVLSGSFASCSLQFVASTTYAGIINLTSQGGLTGPSTIIATLACVAPTSVTGAAAASDSGTAGQTVSQQFRVVTSGSNTVLLQVLGPNTNTWANQVALQCLERSFP